MNTPIADFIRDYAARNPVRLHMPGHKGHSLLGCEPLDITEIPGADELYVADGIIGVSERNAADLFGSGQTLYSTEGSSQCIRAMVYLAATRARSLHIPDPYILAARNAHKTFLHSLALADLDVQWLMPDRSDSLCTCRVTPEQVGRALQAAPQPPAAVYLTSPDYLGGLLPIRDIAAVCHETGVPLLVDNAHGAYLRFLPEDMHPLSAGADLCCDSAHKTLPALTGTAYLHISRTAPAWFADRARDALSLFGSTSPSYLLLASLDLCNRCLSDGFRDELAACVARVAEAKAALRDRGWQIAGTEPMKLTLRAPAGLPGTQLAERLRRADIVCEYADREYVVMMPSVGTSTHDLHRLLHAMGSCPPPPNGSDEKNGAAAEDCRCHLPAPRVALRVRDAIFSPSETVPTELAEGRICAAPTVSCPPAIPLAVSGEVITAEHIRLFTHYGIRNVSVVCEQENRVPCPVN